jgi:hypothetical protein
MEEAFGRPFAAVRVHDDPAAARLNEALGATAFTIGNDIAFSKGSYRPGTRSGDAVIAHELAHTVQQGAHGSGVRVADDQAALERQADQAAAAAIGREKDASALLRPGDTGLRIQALPAVVAGGLILAEATPEIVVAAEIGTDVVLVDGAVTVTADVAAPAIIESTAPAVLPAVTEAAAPAVIDTAVADTAASSISTATVVGVGAAATLSGDTPTSESPQGDCMEQFGYGPCADLRSVEDVASSMASNSVDVTSIQCWGVSSFPAGEVFDCGGAPGQNWHCKINDSEFVISLSGCMCCNIDGTVGFEWHPHQSPGADNDRGRRRQDNRRDRRDQEQRERQRRQRRDQGGDE